MQVQRRYREMLNDWDATLRPLVDPSLPLTNNAAERLLSHWAIVRRPSFGTRSEPRTPAFAMVASIIDTFRAGKRPLAITLPPLVRRAAKNYRCHLCPRFQRGVIAYTESGLSCGDRPACRTSNAVLPPS